MERGSKVRLTTALLLVAVFGAGFALGVAYDVTAEAGDAATQERSDEERERRRGPMYERVGPDERQKILIDSIVAVHREGMRALQKEFRDAYDPRYQELIESTRAAIRGVLSAEQAAQYDSLIAAYEQRRAERAARDDRN